MEKTEKRPGYFARLKKKRQPKQSQSEKADAEQSQSDVGSKTLVISEPAPIGRSQEREQPEKTRRNDGSDDSSRPCSQSRKERSKPPGTVEYTVALTDTLNSIALKFNITPNQLVQLNRLFSHSLVPGQKLFVPDVDQSEAGSQVNGPSRLAASESAEKVRHAGFYQEFP